MKKLIKVALSLLISAGIFLSGFSALAYTVTDGQNRSISVGLRLVKNSDTPVDHENLSADQYYWHSWPGGGSAAYRMLIVKDTGNNRTDLVAYCIEYGKSVSTEDYKVQDLKDTAHWYNLSDTIKRGITYATLYGYPVSNLGAKNCDAYAATQTIIWEFAEGYRNLTGRTSSALFDYAIKGTPAEAAYNTLSNAVINQSKTPSFHNATATLEYDTATEKYKTVLTDTSGQLSSFTAQSPDSRLNISQSGNTLTITTNEHFSGNITLNFKKNTVPSGGPQPLMFLYHASGQKCVTGSTTDPVIARLTVNSKEAFGNVRLIKTSEDGIVAGIPFTITGAGTNKSINTGTNGEILFEALKPGEYTVTEATPDKYVPQQSQKVTVTPGKTATVTFSNILKKFKVEVTKKDSEYTTPQGDASLAGAKYGIYNGDQLIDTYTTDTAGKFTTVDYVCGDSWTLSEISPSEGYLLDPAIHKIGASAGLFSVERNTVRITVNEEVVKGKILIVKHTSDGSTGIETPEAGAVFEVFLTSAGNYLDAKSTERDILTVDENGFAASNKDLPYGAYTVRQRSGWAGKEMITDFQVCVSQHDKTYTYIINNAAFTSKLRIEKRDSETGELVTGGGFGFQIRKPDGELLVQSISYPTPIEIDTFYTNSNGWLMLPEPLPYGTGYELIEVQAAPPYILNSEPVKFDVTGENKDTIITVVMKNSPQKGKVTITKSGEVFASVIEAEGRYIPIYEVRPLPGTKYDIYAEEDISVNGDIKHYKGDFIAKIITDEDGIASLDNLYLGKYRCVETASDGYVKGEDCVFELTYAGQDVALSESKLKFYNERQRVKIDLLKALEQDTMFGIGMNGEILSVEMGLFADEDIIAADGTIVPQDGLIESISVDKNGYALFAADLPVGSRIYIKELATDEHYLLSDEKYPLVFDYAGQNMPTVHLTANGGEPILNKLIRGQVRLKKTDRESGERLAGAVFDLYSPGGILIGSYSTDENGEIFIENIPFGIGYKWIESKAPEGYVFEEKAIFFDITENGEMLELSADNELIPIIPDNPKTGDNQNFGVWFGFIAVALGGLVAVFILKKKK